MKVRCIKLLNSRGQEVTTSSVLKIGRIYDALSISIDESGNGVYVRIHGGKQPSVHPLSQFDIVDPSIPRNWGVHGRSSGGIFLGPLSWSEIGFWEKYFDGDQKARTDFEAEVEIMLSQVPNS
jgi:hypothetical protein